MILSFGLTARVSATALGVHLMQPEEIEDAVKLFNGKLMTDRKMAPTEAQYYVTVPFPLDHLDKPLEAHERWQKFFDQCQKENVIPLVRLTTRFNLEKMAWQIPTRAELVTAIDFLADLDWQSERRHLIVFNEVNHFKEWGGQNDPESYADVLNFVINWAQSRRTDWSILPAAMDLAAGTTADTQEAFAYLEQVWQARPEIFDKIDAWNSHSYPNPAFSAPPEKKGQNSLSGFKEELKWWAKKTSREEQELTVFITETGWEENGRTVGRLKSHYQTAWKNVWQADERIVAVTPFVLRGAPGPFAKFSLLDKNLEPTRQCEAYWGVLEKYRWEF